MLVVESTKAVERRGGDYIVEVSPATHREFGRASRVVLERALDHRISSRLPVSGDPDLVTMGRLRANPDVADHVVRLDQTLRYAVGIAHHPDGEEVLVSSVQTSLSFELREAVASLFGVQHVIGRVATSMMVTAEKGTVQIGRSALEILGVTNGSRLRLQGLERSESGSFRAFSISVPALGLDPEMELHRVDQLDQDPTTGNVYFMDPRAVFGFSEQHEQLDDLPPIWMDKSIRDLVHVPAPLFPVRMRRSTMSAVATEFRTTGMFVVFAVAALGGLFGVENSVRTGMAALVISIAFSLIVIAWGLRQQVSEPSRRRR